MVHPDIQDKGKTCNGNGIYSNAVQPTMFTTLCNQTASVYTLYYVFKLSLKVATNSAWYHSLPYDQYSKVLG